MDPGDDGAARARGAGPLLHARGDQSPREVWAAARCVFIAALSACFTRWSVGVLRC